MATTAEAPSLEDILSYHGFQRDGILCQKCPNEIRIEIALKLENWRLMGRKGFRFESHEVSSIDEDPRYKSVQDQKIALLDAWNHKHGKDASYFKLAQDLFNGGRKDLVDYLFSKLIPKDATDTPSSKPGESSGNPSSLDNSKINGAITESADEDNILNFRCPCKKCTLESYLKNGCPKSRYPYLEMSELSEGDKDNLAQILIKHVKDIVRSFSDLSINTSESLIRRSVSVDKLRSVVVNFCQDKSLSESLRSATTIDATFFVLGEHWSFFNYEILEYIIERLGDDNDKKSLEAFLEKFETFCKHKIFEVAPSSCGHKQSSLKKEKRMFVVVTEKSMLQNLGDVKDAQHKLASMLGINSAQLRLHRIDEGSVILVMSVPDIVAQKLFPLPKDKVAELKREGFIIFVPKRLQLTETLTVDVSSTNHDDDDDLEEQISVYPITIDLATEQEQPTCTQACSENSQLNCFKCTEALSDPYSISCCGTKYCSKCIGEIQSGNNPCLCCGKYDFQFVSTAELQLLSQKKSYTCPYCNDFTSSYEDVENHWPICQGSFPVMCPNQCGQLIQRHKLANHVAKHCPSKIVNCPYKAIIGCEEQVPREKMFFHLLTHIEPRDLQKQIDEAYKYFAEAKEMQKLAIQSKEAGFDCEFVMEVTKAFQTHCSVCLLILREPYAAGCCGKSFCSFCIQQIKQSSKPCPLCKNNQYELHPNKGLQQSLYQLSVYCTNRSKGCEWEGELGEQDKHINSNPAPSMQLWGCQFAQISCNYCSGEFQRCEIPEHQSKQCPERIITCPLNCGKELKYNHLEQHILADCIASRPTSNFTQSTDVSIEDVFRWICKDDFKDHETLLLLKYSIDNQKWNCDETNDDGDTALHLACKAKRFSIVEFLLKNMMSNPNVLNNDYKAPIQLTNDLCIISQLIQHKAVFSTVDVKTWAKKFDLMEVIEIVTLNDPNRRTVEGDTALHIACILDRYDVVDYLLTERHCYPSIMNDYGNMAIELTLNHEVTRLLVENDAIVTSRLVTNWLKQEDRDLKLKLVESLVKVNPDFKTSDGDSVLHLTCKHGSSHMVDYLLDMYKCDPNIENIDGKTPIQLTHESDIDTTEVLVTHGATTNSDIIFTLISKASCNNKCVDIFMKSLNNSTWKPDDRTGSVGNTALHLACMHNILGIVHILLSEANSNPNEENNDEQTPFQLCKDPSIMQELIQHGAILQSKSLSHLLYSDITPDRVVRILQSAVEKGSWNPQTLLNNGDSVLHVACKLNKYELVCYLLSEVKSDPNKEDFDGKTPIVYAEGIETVKELIRYNVVTSSREVFMLINNTTKVYGSEEETVQLLQTLLQYTTWNPDDKTSQGDTALHLACSVNSPIIVEFFLSEANCNPNIPNACGSRPFEITSNPSVRQHLVSYGTKTDILYNSHRRILGTNQPLKPPVKIFVVGNDSVGKSTLIEALQNIGRWLLPKKITKIPSIAKTTGVIPHDFESKFFGPVTFHNFAGQREFYSSHAAVLQIAVQSSTPIILLLVNLCDSDYDIRQTISYWFSFLENQCTLVDCKPRVIVVGSHADVAKSTNRCDKITKICLSYPFINLDFVRFIAMDCQYSKSPGMTELQHYLSTCCNELRIKENITFNAHCFYAYLSKIKFTVGKLESVLEEIRTVNNDVAIKYIPQTLGAIYKICIELNDRGHILFLKDPNEAENSWIIFDKTAILSEVVGTIFAPKDFLDHKQLASSTGVVPLSKFKTYFPQYDPELLIGFLTHLEFCHEVSDQELARCISEQYSPAPKERYYLFPGLIAQDLDSLAQMVDHIDCGWILQIECKNSYKFFDSQFLQVLLLSLAFSFALVKESQEEIPVLQRKCFLWKNGILWSSRYEVKILVEVLSGNKAVVILMQHTNKFLLHCAKLQSQVIQKIFQCIKKYCPFIDFAESLIVPHGTVQYPLKNFSHLPLVSIQNIAQAASVTRPYSSFDSTVTRLPLFEPYVYLGTKITKTLMSEDTVMTNEVITDQFLAELAHTITVCGKEDLFLEVFESELESPTLFQVLQEWRDHHEGTYQDLRHMLEQFSIFSGRNLLKIAEQEPSSYDSQSHDSKESSTYSDAVLIDISDIIDESGGNVCRTQNLLQRKVFGHHDAPKLKDLMELKSKSGKKIRVVHGAASQWKELASVLGFQQDDIDSISRTYSKTHKACRHMLALWLKGDKGPWPVTWTSLIHGLISAGLVELADDLNESIDIHLPLSIEESRGMCI